MEGKTAHIEIVDKATGGWGHINVDDIVQSDIQKAVPWVPEPLTTRSIDRNFTSPPRKTG